MPGPVTHIGVCSAEITQFDGKTVFHRAGPKRAAAFRAGPRALPGRYEGPYQEENRDAASMESSSGFRLD